MKKYNCRRFCLTVSGGFFAFREKREACCEGAVRREGEVEVEEIIEEINLRAVVWEADFVVLPGRREGRGDEGLKSAWRGE